MGVKCLTDRQNYNSIDLAKLIGSFLVIAIHTNIFISFSETFNWYFINLFCRIAVYFFFIVSAYFFFQKIQFNENGKIKNCKDNWNTLKKYFVRMTTLYLVWTAIYLIPNIVKWYQENCLTLANFKGYILSVFLNSSYYHLWFLISLIYAIPMMFIMLLLINKRALIVISLIVYIVGLLFGTYCFIETPFNGIYDLLSKYWPRLCTVIFDVIPICSLALVCDSIKTTKRINAVLAILFLAGYSIEGMMLYFLAPNQASSYNAILLPTILFVFLAIKSINLPLRNPMIVRKSSTLIYCMHPLIMWLVSFFVDSSQINSLLWFGLISILSFAISLLIVMLYDKFTFMKFLKYVM